MHHDDDYFDYLAAGMVGAEGRPKAKATGLLHHDTDRLGHDGFRIVLDAGSTLSPLR